MACGLAVEALDVGEAVFLRVSLLVAFVALFGIPVIPVVPVVSVEGLVCDFLPVVDALVADHRSVVGIDHFAHCVEVWVLEAS